MVKKNIKSSPLEKALTLLSLGCVIAGIVLGNHGITGNVVGNNTVRFVGAGLSLFIVGLLGVFIAIKGK